MADTTIVTLDRAAWTLLAPSAATKVLVQLVDNQDAAWFRFAATLPGPAVQGGHTLRMAQAMMREHGDGNLYGRGGATVVVTHNG